MRVVRETKPGPGQLDHGRSMRALVAADQIAPTPLAILAALVLAAWLVLVAVVAGTTVMAQDVSPSRGSVEIRAGTCASPGDVTALLEALAVPTSVSGDQVLGTSVTDVMQPLGELTAEPRVVLALASAGAEGRICGPLPGQPVDGHGSAVLLADVDGEIAGIAWLSELGTEATRVHVFVFDDGSRTPARPDGPGSASHGPGASASATPSPSATPDVAAVPGAEVDPGEDIDVDVDG